jgi:glycosyltransferase involved in cell wall biosynthesis
MVASVRSVLAASRYDFVVLDQYALGWALEECHDIFTAKGRPIAYLAHNYEAALAKATAREFRGSVVKRALLTINAAKIARMERALVSTADTVTAISRDDADALTRLNPKKPPIVILPGVDVESYRPCTINDDTPRRLLMVGSFHWVPKQLNLEHFLSAADPVALRKNARLDIIGDVPAPMAKKLSVKYKWVRFLGFVERLGPLMSNYRLALNIEHIGGGFKLKILTYVAAGLPVAALSQSLTGVPRELRECMIVRDDGPDLLAAAVDALDNVRNLSQRTAKAKECVERLFNWDQSAQRLVGAVLSPMRQRTPARLL